MIALIHPPNRSQPEFPNALNAPGFCPSCGPETSRRRSWYSRTSWPAGYRPAGRSRRRISRPDTGSARCSQGQRTRPPLTEQSRASRKMCFLYALFDSCLFSDLLRSAQLLQCITEVCKKQSPSEKRIPRFPSGKPGEFCSLNGRYQFISSNSASTALSVKSLFGFS